MNYFERRQRQAQGLPVEKTAKEVAKEAKKKAGIPKVSEKQKARLKEYKPIRVKKLNEFPMCEIRLPGCTIKAVEVHHPAGKVGDDFTDYENMKSACQHCHRIVEDNPEMAKAAGHSKSRLNKK